MVKLYLQQLPPLKYEELSRVIHFKLLYTDIVSHNVHFITQYGPKCNCASRKQQHYTPKRSATTLSNLEDVHLFC